MHLAVPENKSLEEQLANRPNAQDLVDRNIMKDPKIAPAIQQHRDELEKHRIADKLNKELHERPDRQKLVEEHILRK
ncbi:hypothetical protein BD408DRAFT_432074 [Parasitella parasitica]|nr:hypothetical protein BD408DRAFT_432074 [Parasitella parasitica]